MLKKAQYDIVAWIGIVIGLLIVAPILYMAVSEILTGFSTAINATSPAAAAAVDIPKDTFLTWLDYLVVIGMLVAIILLFVFAFTADAHPLFLIFWILSGAFIMMFASYVVLPAQEIFGMSWFSDAALGLPLTEFIVTNFSIILLGIIVVSGIIMYAKFRGKTTELH